MTGKEAAIPTFQTLMDSLPVIPVPGVWDGLSAKLAHMAGFQAVGSSGFAISASLGYPDAEIYSMHENLERVREIADATPLPLMSDIDTGYGNAINVLRTVREFERAGATALFIEDQLSPKRCPISVGTPVPIISAEEAVGKIRAACDARSNPQLLIIARIEAHGEEALRRAELYAEAGADMIMPVSKSFDSLEGWAECHRLSGLPLVSAVAANTWLEEAYSPERMSAAGIKIAFLATQVLFGAVSGMQRALSRFAGGGERFADISADHISHKEFSKLIGFPEMEILQTRYLPPE